MPLKNSYDYHSLKRQQATERSRARDKQRIAQEKYKEAPTHQLKLSEIKQTMEDDTCKTKKQRKKTGRRKKKRKNGNG